MRFEAQFSKDDREFDAKYGNLYAIHGKSAYEIAVKNGFDGTETEWLESLRGKDGINAGAVLYTPQTLTEEQKAQARANIGAATISGGYVNVFDPSENTVDKAVNNAIVLSSGAIRVDTHSSDKNYFVTGKIAVEPNVEYVMSKAFWPSGYDDLNKGRCYSSTDAALEALTWEDIGDGNVKFITPLNSAYVRFTFRKSTMSFSVSSPFDEIIAYFNGVFTLNMYSENVGKILDGSIGFEKLTPELQSLYLMKDKTIVNFGDSIFGNSRPPRDISTTLAKMTGATVKNCAFGGCRMGVHTGHWDAFSMYRLAYAVANNDYSLQNEALNYDDRTSYAEEPLALIKETDFSKVDIVTVAYGTNDWAGNNVLDNADNLYDTATVCGALRYSVETLLTAFPQLRIFVLLPTYRFWMDDEGAFVNDSETRTNNHGKTLGEYNQAIRGVAESYNLPVIDNYKQLGINKFNRTQYFPANDGSHHNENGRKMIATHLAKKMW